MTVTPLQSKLLTKINKFGAKSCLFFLLTKRGNKRCQLVSDKCTSPEATLPFSVFVIAGLRGWIKKQK